MNSYLVIRLNSFLHLLINIITICNNEIESLDCRLYEYF